MPAWNVSVDEGPAPQLGSFEPGFGESLKAAVGSTFEENVTTLGYDYLKNQSANNGLKMDKAEAEAMVKDAGVKLTIPDSGYTKEALGQLIQRQTDTMTRQSVMDRTPWSWLGSPARGTAMLLTGLTDPLNIASAFIPVVGEARAATILAKTTGLGRVGARAAIGATEGAVGAAMLEPAVYGFHQGLQDDYKMVDSLINLGFGGLLGGGLHAVGGTFADSMRATPTASRLMEDVSPETREATLRTAVADMVRGRTPDVEALIHAETPPRAPDIREVTVFHGTTEAFDDFDPAKGMFTSNRGRAENYAMGGKGRVIEAKLDIKNPMPWEQAFGKTPAEIKAAGFDGAVQLGANGEVMRAVVVGSEQVQKAPFEIREVPGGFEAYKDGKRVGYLKDNLERGQAKQIQESANIDIVKVDADVRGQGIGSALYRAFYEKHEGMVAPSGKTTSDAWAVWQRNYPDKVEAFVRQEAARIRDGANPQMVIGNITNPEIAQRVMSEASNPAGKARDVLSTAERQRSPESAMLGSPEASKAADARIAEAPKDHAVEAAQAELTDAMSRLSELQKNLETGGADPAKLSRITEGLKSFDDAIKDAANIGKAIIQNAICGLRT